MKIIFLLLILCSTAFAEDVRVYTDYSPVRVSADSDNEAGKSGLTGNFKVISRSQIPQDREDRDAWKIDKGAVKIDADKKAVISKKKSDKVSAIGKLKAMGLTDGELASLGVGTGE